jgi:hypothetical protein
MRRLTLLVVTLLPAVASARAPIVQVGASASAMVPVPVVDHPAALGLGVGIEGSVRMPNPKASVWLLIEPMWLASRSCSEECEMREQVVYAGGRYFVIPVLALEVGTGLIRHAGVADGDAGSSLAPAFRLGLHLEIPIHGQTHITAGVHLDGARDTSESSHFAAPWLSAGLDLGILLGI